MRAPRLPLQYLAAFRAAALTENLRAAADQLSVTHSAVSQQIRALEAQLGFPVFDRQGRRVVLNAAGRALLHGVERAYQELDQGLRTAATAHGVEQRSLRITALPSFCQRWLLPRLGRWHACHPEVALEIDATQRLVDLEREGFDLALRQGQGPWPGLVSEPLFESNLLPVASPALAHQLIGQPLADLALQPLLGDPNQWSAWFEQSGLNRQIVPVATFNDAGLLLQATEQGMGIGLTRELLAADALLDGRLVRVAPRQRLLMEPQRYHVVYPPALKDSPALTAFIDWLHAETAQSRAALDGAFTCLSGPVTPGGAPLPGL
ncbi:DNA-binding transcriptional regulator, LysR family [Roseateles sp. YR242]|uniref:LysR substrate-binding domain-containing protein n=1 Tax=Roseateles sp. YR242 TaxID=1855305 RepID=UPI0008C86E91|nr:LysR substrate-binding domain-containing protein [Roseateles sp. YR242]SEK39113.1 DNA-binding transcriptional regulator, LysR family [Roseateles sp. YR242]